MRVALVTETYPPEVNGVAMTLERLVRGLAERGHGLQVIRPRQKRWDIPRLENGIEEWPVPGLPLPGYHSLRFGMPAYGKLMTNWQGKRPDIVHVATEGPLGWSAIRAARELELPISSSFHTNFHSYGQHYGFGPLRRLALSYLRFIHNQTQLTLAPSPELARDLAKSGFHNTGVLSRGVDTRQFNPAFRDPALRREWGADEQTPVAIYVGRLAGEKNIPLTVAAFKTMQEILPHMKMVIVGDGPELRNLKLLHPDFIYAGVQRGKNLAQFYASGDVFLFASKTETFGNVVTEAMASGLVVLSFDYAAAKQYIRAGENGVSVPFGDEQAFLAAARTLAKAVSGWNTMRIAARKTALSISWDSVIDHFEASLRKLTDSVPSLEVVS